MFAFGAGSGRHITADQWNSSYGLSTSNQVNLADSTSNELYLTGVQLEVGTAASDFEFLPVDVNKQRCLRYFQDLAPKENDDRFTLGENVSTTRCDPILYFKPEMRAAPDVNLDTSSENPVFYSYSGSPPGYTSVNSMESTTKNFHWDFNTGTHNQAGKDFDVKGSGAFITIDAEL